MGPADHRTKHRSPRRLLEVLAAAALAAALVLTRSPTPSSAIGGGLSFADRLTLSGTPRNFLGFSCNEAPLYTVPEGC